MGLFLNLLSNSINILDLGSSLVFAFRSFCYSICSEVYRLITFLYNLFDALCNARIIDNVYISELYSRIGLILGLIMLFRVLFSFIQMFIEPDSISDKEKGAFNVVKKCIIVIVLLGTMPSLFSFAYRIQNILISNDDGGNIISRLLLPVSVDTDNFGAVLSENLLFSFYTLNEEVSDSSEYATCEVYNDALMNQIEIYNRFDLGFNCLGRTVEITQNAETVDVFVMNYNGLFSVISGIFVCWFLLVYCFSVGVRVIQLAFLEIIAPMPIISYLSPKKDGMFQKWGKMCLTTYLDVFIRIAVINFVIFAIGLVIDNINDVNSIFWVTAGTAAGSNFAKMRTYLFIIIVLALLQFAKKAPELIKELLPKSWVASGDFGFGLKNRDFLGKAFAAAGGVAAGSAIGLVSGWAGGKGVSKFTGALGGVLGGTGRGLIGGYKNKGTSFGDITKGIGDVRKKQADYGLKRAQRIAAGTGLGERIGDYSRDFFGVQSSYAQTSATLNAVSAATDAIENASSSKRLDEQYKEANKLRAEKVIDLKRELSEKFANIDSDISLSDVEKEYRRREAENLYNSQVSALDASIKEIKEQRDYMYEAVKYNSLGEIDKLEKMYSDGKIDKQNGDYYINGVKVSKYDSVAEKVKDAEKVTGESFADYKAIDDKKTELSGVQARYHKNG